MTNEPAFDAVIHAPNRLQICALLTATSEMEFATLRDAIDVSDSVLSKHIKVLEDDGVVRVRKATSASRQRTWLTMTKEGRRRFDDHVAALRAMLPTVDNQ